MGTSVSNLGVGAPVPPHLDKDLDGEISHTNQALVNDPQVNAKHFDPTLGVEHLRRPSSCVVGILPHTLKIPRHRVSCYPLSKQTFDIPFCVKKETEKQPSDVFESTKDLQSFIGRQREVLRFPGLQAP